MKLTLKEVNDILQKEIEWCSDHPNFASARDKELAVKLTNGEWMGFINGLRQAQTLIEIAESEVINSDYKSYIESHPQLRPLANLANELNDEDLQDVIQYVGFMNYRRRVFNIAKGV